MDKKATLEFTLAELDILYSALNRESLHYAHSSMTYGKSTGRQDYYHKLAEMAGRLQSRVFDAQQEIRIAQIMEEK